MVPSPRDLNTFVTPIREELHAEVWKLIYSVVAEGHPGCYAVDIIRDGVPKSRTMTASKVKTPEEAIEVLREKALKWIAQYEARPHSGDTDWGTL